MKRLLIVALLSIGQLVFSQAKGTVSGKLTDKDMNGEALPFANVFVKGTSIGSTTDMDGNYTISVPVGNQTIVFSFVGYKTIEKQVTVVAGKTVVINQEMGSSEGVALEEVKITGTVSKEKESALLLEQKKATVIKESIGAVELSKKGVSDAAAATTKVSGVSKQEGSSKVYVRGLGDRYNTTTINGLPLPSNDPANKNISLDIFSTDIIQNVGVSKSFDASLSGDVAGANIDIKSKEFSGKSKINLGVGFGGNSQTTFKKFNTIDGANWFGIAEHTEHRVTSLNTVPFTDTFKPVYGKAQPNLSVSLSGGKKFNFDEDSDSSFSMFLVGSFSNSFRARKGFAVNILDKIEDSNGNITGFTSGSDYPEAWNFNYSNSKILMGNFVYKINPKNKISFNSIFIHSNSQKIQQYLGTKPDIADQENEFAYLVLQTQNQNRLLVNQLLSNHKIGEATDLNIGLSYNIIDNDEPNRKKTLFKIDSFNNIVQLASGTPRNNSRYYHNLDEGDINALVTMKKYFGDRSENKGAIKFGYSFRNTKRDFSSIYFDYNLEGTTIVDIENPDEILNQKGLDNGLYRFQTSNGSGSKALEPFTYSATKFVHAPFLSLDYNLSDDFLLSAGVRYEIINMDIEWDTNLSSSEDLYKGPKELNRNYILPSLNLKYNFTDDNLLRLSFSKTYTYPQFKEVAPFVYEAANYQEYGYEDLKPSENYNFDLKWEMFPNRDELISATLFGKIINNSINRIELNAASDNVFSYLNTGDSKVYGVEVELKKNLFVLNEDNNEKIRLGFNATYMYNNQEFNKTKQFNPTNDEDPLEGAAPFLANIDLSYSKKVDNKETNASLVFNYQDEKLYSIGTVNGLEGIYQKGVPTLDFVFKRSFTSNLGAKLSVKNILNPKIEQYRDLNSKPVTKSYKNGINFSIGLNYKL